ncbi:helix-turn-helix domain-containing protein [Rapidithrix thailandica]|uniref:Helix-turn-helix domain-containing protein n=1 Tax=Rapidithrix thailandica TaxID=413964 RepID=A0AAW9S6G2_9BACT
MATQIITTDDLLEFKLELFRELKNLLEETSYHKRKKWLKSGEVRELLGISPGTLQNMRVNGSLPYTKIGGVIFYDYQDICKMLEENRITRPQQASSFIFHSSSNRFGQ